MKTDLECVPCIIKQCINTLNLTKCSENIKRKAIKGLLNDLEKIDYDLSPAYNSDIAYIASRKFTGVKDPYCKLKEESNKAALEIYPKLKEIITKSPDRLYAGIKIAVEGNIIDLGINGGDGSALNFEKIIDDIKNMPLAVDDYAKFKKSLGEAKNILYISDNAGELVFDRVFIKELIKQHKNVVLSVKSGPIINDATRKDAEEVSLDSLVKVIETGSDRIGINFNYVSDEFLKEFRKADLIISKGQGNFETLDDVDANIFFILKAKCEKIARELGVNYLDVVMVKRESRWGSKKV